MDKSLSQDRFFSSFNPLILLTRHVKEVKEAHKTISIGYIKEHESRMLFTWPRIIIPLPSLAGSRIVLNGSSKTSKPWKGNIYVLRLEGENVFSASCANVRSPEGKSWFPPIQSWDQAQKEQHRCGPKNPWVNLFLFCWKKKTKKTIEAFLDPRTPE